MPEPELSFRERERTHLLDEAESFRKEAASLQVQLTHVTQELVTAKTNAPYFYDRLNKAQPRAPQVESQVKAKAADGMLWTVTIVIDGLLENVYNELFRMIHRSAQSRRGQIREIANLKALLVAWHRSIQERLGVVVKLPFPYETKEAE